MSMAPDVELVGSWEQSVRRRVTELLNHTMLYQVLALALGLVAWETYAMGQPAYIFPSMGVVASAFLELVTEHGLLDKFLNSLISIVTGFAIAIAVGVPVAFIMGLNERIDRVMNPYVNALYVAPISAFVPLIITIGGATFESRVFVVFLFAVFEITIDTYQGIATTPRGLIDVAESFGASRWYVIRRVIFPNDLPYMFAGFRLGIGRSVRGMVLAELLVEFSNLGGLIRLMQNNFRIDGVLAVAVLIMALGVALTKLVKLVEIRTITWSEEVDL
jgi:ABC-type nitrate/sulfonate/bicarbonate transport system permease component